MRRLRFIAALFIAGISMLAHSGEALANSAQTSWYTPENGLGGPVLAPTPVSALHEKLRIDCTGDETCAFEATYEIENPQAESLEVVGAFFAFGPTTVDAFLDGTDVRGTLAEAEEADLVKRARGMVVVKSQQAKRAEPVRGFRFRLEGKRRAILVFKGELRTLARAYDDLNEGYSLSPPTTRHPLLFHSTRDYVRQYAYPIWPIRTWGGSPTIDVELLVGEADEIGPDAAWFAFAKSEVKNHVRRVTATFDAAAVPTLGFERRLARNDSFIAGPVLGIGGRLDKQEFRLRAGLELTRPAKWAIYSVNLDSNLKDYLVASAVIEASTPSVFFFVPALSVGAGLPVRFEKGGPTRVGVRTQLGLNLPFLGLVFPVDYFPAAGPGGDHVDLSLLGRISF